MKVISDSNEAMRLSKTNTGLFILSIMEQVSPKDSWQESHHGNFIVVEPNDHPIDDFQFIGKQGLLSDLFDDSEIGDDDFATPFEWAFHHPQFQLYELYRQNNDETATVFIIPEGYVESHSDLKRLIEDYLRPTTVGADGEENTGTTNGTTRREVK